jgi:hemoglobin-like flavoprotein
MTPEQIDLVERSIAELEPVMDEVVTDFYAGLFTIAPATRAMFAVEGPEDAGTVCFARQREKFAAQLAEIMLVVRDHDRFLAGAESLGARHAGYGVVAAHYEIVGRALLDALAGHLRDRWTPALADAWRLAFNLTAEAMMGGAARVPAAEPPGP